MGDGLFAVAVSERSSPTDSDSNDGPSPGAKSQPDAAKRNKSAFPETRERGFTLLELLVAVALTSVVILGLMAVFRNMVSVYGEIRERRESAMQLRTLVGLLGDDLRTVSGRHAFIGGTGERGGRTERLLEFVSAISVERQEAEPALTQVLAVYSLTRAGGGDRGDWLTLAREERPHPSLIPSAMNAATAAGGWREAPVPILQQVESLKFFFEMASGEEQDFCSVPPGGVLPAFVRLEAVLRHSGGVTEHSLRFPVGKPVW